MAKDEGYRLTAMVDHRRAAIFRAAFRSAFFGAADPVRPNPNFFANADRVFA
jgi:hypothetical protein